MGNFFAELKRRHVYRVAAAYVVVAWLILQVVNNIAPGLNLPNSAVTLVIVLLSTGFPIALIFAWIFDIKTTGPSDPLASKAKTTGLDFVLIGALVAMIGIFLYQQFAGARGERAVQQTVTASGVTPAQAGISVAVLPFVNLSGDPSQDFFSDGMTEEITSALAKIPDLVVIGRTSAFQYKGRAEDLRAIGQALNAGYLIEGSVRKVTDRVRITAQLIRAENGVHLWTENYDRQIIDIFATQEDIAQAIAGALRVPLGLKQGDSLVRNRTNDVRSYDQYLNAKALVRARAPKSLADATLLLEQVVARDPNYAPAWALLSAAYELTPIFHPAFMRGAFDEFRRVVDASLPKAEAAAQRAIQLDVNLADGYVSLGLVQRDRGKFVLAEDLFKQALALDANNPDALHLYSDLLGAIGRLKEGLAMRQHLQALEPFVPIFNLVTAMSSSVSGQSAASITMLKALPPDFTLGAGGLAGAYAMEGRYSEAADALRSIPSESYPPAMLEEAVRLLRSAPATAVSPQTLPRLGGLSFLFLYVGVPDRSLEFYEGNVEAGYRGGPVAIPYLWHASFAPVRKTDRFKAFVRKAGIVEYWLERGWPDLCRPVGADDFVCD